MSNLGSPSRVGRGAGGGIIREATAADAPAIAHVHVESWRTTYPGIIPDDFLANLSVERRAQFWAETLSTPDHAGFAYVAEDETGMVISFAAGGPEMEQDSVYTGELYAIYLLAEAQGKGIGRQLARAVAERLAAAGHEAMLTWVAAANPFRHFYGALGGLPVRERQIIIGGTSLSEVAYGWKDTRQLRQPSMGG